MQIEKQLTDHSLNIKLSGRLDSYTSPELEESLFQDLDSLTDLTFDLTDLAYISSAGLRVLLLAQKAMNKQGTMRVLNPNSDVMDVFEVTGFTDILTVEKTEPVEQGVEE
ncbi:MAG: STAS domain-containing protein [Erysipelotrichaceae bacterium]|nr:STAS domain-containing protein [Erysipelotrichaceae bacterium]MBQ1523496.1 STAS domain-containing protein [Erysipelotrichaceae bacterium]MBR2701638.1 STAS domain-containing protein [Erysipelotrichaceae bacterium]MBR2745605.1 STAS domain-containing protein [Erysipelotrichaceae bacterium]